VCSPVSFSEKAANVLNELSFAVENANLHCCEYVHKDFDANTTKQEPDKSQIDNVLAGGMPAVAEGMSAVAEGMRQWQKECRQWQEQQHPASAGNAIRRKGECAERQFV